MCVLDYWDVSSADSYHLTNGQSVEDIVKIFMDAIEGRKFSSTCVSGGIITSYFNFRVDNIEILTLLGYSV